MVVLRTFSELPYDPARDWKPESNWHLAEQFQCSSAESGQAECFVDTHSNVQHSGTYCMDTSWQAEISQSPMWGPWIEQTKDGNLLVCVRAGSGIPWLMTELLFGMIRDIWKKLLVTDTVFNAMGKLASGENTKFYYTYLPKQGYTNLDLWI